MPSILGRQMCLRREVLIPTVISHTVLLVVVRLLWLDLWRGSLGLRALLRVGGFVVFLLLWSWLMGESSADQSDRRRG